MHNTEVQHNAETCLLASTFDYTLHGKTCAVKCQADRATTCAVPMHMSPRALPRSSTLTPRNDIEDSERMPAPAVASGAATDRPSHRHRPKKRDPNMVFGSQLLDKMQVCSMLCEHLGCGKTAHKKSLSSLCCT